MRYIEEIVVVIKINNRKIVSIAVVKTYSHFSGRQSWVNKNLLKMIVSVC